LKEITEVLKERHPLYYSSVGMIDIFPFLAYMPCFKHAAELKKFFIEEVSQLDSAEISRI
jgi:hypothetical protein